jgi:uncharacterized protein (TIGR00106 family)
MAVMDIQVSPRKPGTVSVSDAVAAAHRVIQESGLTHVLHPMGTCIEGEASKLYGLANRIHQRLADLGYERIGVYLRIDDRRDKRQTMDDKLSSVQRKLGGKK